MIRSRMTIKTAWPWLLIIVIMVVGATLTCLRASRPRRYADTHQDAAAGSRGRHCHTGADTNPSGCRHTAAGADRGRVSYASRN